MSSGAGAAVGAHSSAEGRWCVRARGRVEGPFERGSGGHRGRSSERAAEVGAIESSHACANQSASAMPDLASLCQIWRSSCYDKSGIAAAMSHKHPHSPQFGSVPMLVAKIK